MRYLLLILVALGLTAAAPKPKGWLNTVNRTDAGAYVLGNPKAKVMLVEFASYTCPHCAEMAEQSHDTLKGRMIASGSLRLEFRHALRDKLDIAAAILARCTGADFFATSDAIYAAQNDWYPQGMSFMERNDTRLGLYPELARLRAYADGAGLTELVKARGLGDDKIDACFADEAGLATMLKMSDAAWAAIPGTPAFVINGKAAPGATWAALEPQLRAAGAK